MEYQFESLGPALRWVVLVFLLLAVIVAIAVVAGIAAFPGWIAKRRNHPQAAAINVCGWFGLPTGILWVVAVVWAYLESPATTTPHSPTHEVDSLRQQIEKLAAAVQSLEEAQRP